MRRARNSFSTTGLSTTGFPVDALLRYLAGHWKAQLKTRGRKVVFYPDLSFGTFDPVVTRKFRLDLKAANDIFGSSDSKSSASRSVMRILDEAGVEFFEDGCAEYDPRTGQLPCLPVPGIPGPDMDVQPRKE